MFQKSQCFDHQTIIKYQIGKLQHLPATGVIFLHQELLFMEYFFTTDFFIFKKPNINFVYGFLHFLKLAQNAKISAFSAKFCFNLFRKKMRNFREKKCENFVKKNSERWLDSSNSLYQTFTKVKEEKLLLSHKTNFKY